MTKDQVQSREHLKSQPEQESQLQADVPERQKLAPARALAGWLCKKHLLLAILPMLIQALVYSLPILMNGGRGLNIAYGSLYVGEILLFPLGLLFGLILVHKLFSFQHKAQGANLIYALPLTRAKLYLTLLGVLGMLMGLTRLVSLAQNCLLFLPQGVNFLYLLQMELALYLKLWAALALLIYFYTEGANSFNAQLLAIFTNVFWPLLFLVLQIITQACLPSFAGFDWTAPLPLLFAPYISGFFPGMWQGWTLGARLIVSLAFLILAYLAFLNRPAEKMARYDVETPAFILPRAIISVASGLTLGLLLYYIRGEFTQHAPGWIIFILGLIMGSLLANLLQDLLYSRGVVKFRRALTKALALTVPGLLIVALLASGFFGYDYRLPQEGPKTKLMLRQAASTRQNFPYLLGFNPDPGNTELKEAGLPRAWTLDDPDQQAFFIKLLDKAYEEGMPGLALPRNLSSFNRYRGIKENDQAIDDNGMLDVTLSWQNPGSPFWHKRVLPLPEENVESLAPLLKDPALAAFFYNLAYAQLDQAYLIHKGATATASLEQSEPVSSEKFNQQSSWLQLWQCYMEHDQLAHQNHLHISTINKYADPLIYALLADYSKLSPEERAELGEQSELQLSLRFNNRLSSDVSSGMIPFDRRIIFGREKADTLKLPVKEDFSLTKQVIVNLLADQQASLLGKDDR